MVDKKHTDPKLVEIFVRVLRHFLKLCKDVMKNSKYTMVMNHDMGKM